MKDLVLKGLRITVVSLALSGCNTPDNLYLDPAQPIEARVDNLMKQMTLQEKVAQMCQYVGLKHMQTAERDLLITEMEKSHAQGFYKNLHSTDVARMTEEGLIGDRKSVV